MDVIVSGRHLEITDRLRETAVEKVSKLSRFLDGMDRAEVHFFEERNPRIHDKEVCEVTMEGHGHHVRAKSAAPDPFVAIDLAVDKLEQQLHRLKSKLVKRHHGQNHQNHSTRPASVDSVPPGEISGIEEEDADDGIRIVKTKRFMMKPMTPEEAALQMELVGHDFYFFSNSETERAAVVYRRSDGDIGLIDEAG